MQPKPPWPERCLLLQPGAALFLAAVYHRPAFPQGQGHELGGVLPPEHERARSPRKGGPEQKIREKRHRRKGGKTTNLQQI
ncbi:hypothetical protein H671_3g8557 [Cricetulus griseus]|uniref:Uncharacterized protein n=1 Tax=Cricetulus griseus TaxID=10029 RepID=A0A061IIC9_CRIGR|nr:hypothetical protein H671_3g8557 [Cricetulus griseus]